jgi:hypothetical protein
MKHDLNGKLVVVVVILGAKEELENCKVLWRPCSE